MMTKFGEAKINNIGYYVISNGKFRDNKYLHRLIYEEFHKLTLLPSAIVHHKDGNKLNNSIDNLEMVSKSEHNKIHHKNKVNSPETIEKMSKSKMRNNNPMYGTGKVGYYRVYKVKKPQAKQGFVWIYEYPDNGKQRTISRVNLNNLEKEVKSRNLDWHKIGDDN